MEVGREFHVSSKFATDFGFVSPIYLEPIQILIEVTVLGYLKPLLILFT